MYRESDVNTVFEVGAKKVICVLTLTLFCFGRVRESSDHDICKDKRTEVCTRKENIRLEC